MFVIIAFFHLLLRTLVFRLWSPNGDGQAFWQPYKRRYGVRDHVRASWRRLPRFDRFEELKNEEGEIAHFLYQLYGLQREEPTVRKLMQVALNLGQFVGTVPPWEWHKHGFEFGMINIFNYMTLSEIMKLRR